MNFKWSPNPTPTTRRAGSLSTPNERRVVPNISSLRRLSLFIYLVWSQSSGPSSGWVERVRNCGWFNQWASCFEVISLPSPG